MRYVVALIGGLVLLALGAQGAIRLIADHQASGLLGWVPGGFAAQLVCYLAVAAVGAALASWGKPRTEK